MSIRYIDDEKIIYDIPLALADLCKYNIVVEGNSQPIT